MWYSHCSGGSAVFFQKWAWMKSKLMWRFSVFPLGRTPTELSKNWISLMKGLTSRGLFGSGDRILRFICTHTQKDPRSTWPGSKLFIQKEYNVVSKKRVERNRYFTSFTSLTAVRVNGSDTCKSFCKPQRKPSFSTGKFKPRSLLEISLYRKWEPFVKQTQ